MRRLGLCSLFLVLLVSNVWSAAKRYPDTAWMQYATPEEAGWSSSKLAEARKFADSIGVSALMVIQDGAVVTAWGNIEQRYKCHSIRKSFLSALYGIHVHAGNIDLNKTLGELGIDDIPPTLTAAEKQARIVDLLRSRSGVYHPAAYETASMKKRRPARGAHAPGAFWWYNNWDFNTLGTIFEQETGGKIFEEFQTRITQPIQMQDFRLRDTYYHLEPENSIHPAYPFRMSARDMARFGLLFLNNGRWKDQQIIPETWVKESMQAYSHHPKRGTGYGYMWWVYDRQSPFAQYGAYAAAGYGGHSILVLPKIDTVIVRRVDTYQGHSLRRKDRSTLTQKIVAARTSEPRLQPALQPLTAQPSRRVAAIALSPDVLRTYVKDYHFESGTVVRLTLEQDKLLAHTRRGVFELIPLSRTTFHMEDMEQPLFVEMDAQGQPTRVIVERLLDDEGRVHLKHGRVQRALEVFRQTVAYYPNSSRAHTRLGRVYLESEETSRAVEHFQKAVELNPNNWSARKHLKQLKAEASAR